MVIRCPAVPVNVNDQAPAVPTVVDSRRRVLSLLAPRITLVAVIFDDVCEFANRLVLLRRPGDLMVRPVRVIDVFHPVLRCVVVVTAAAAA